MLKLSEWYTWLSYGGGAIALVLAARAMAPRWPRGGCSCCGYDRRGLGDRACPECGARHTARGYRPRWALLVCAIMLGTPGLTWWLLREPVRKAWWWVRYPRWELVSNLEVGPVEVRVFHGGRPDNQILGRRVEARKDGRLFFESESLCEVSLAGGYRSPKPYHEDLTGDGVPELILEDYSGGAHCCTTWRIFDVSGKPVLLDVIEWHDFHAGVVDCDGNGVFEIACADWRWTYWNASYVESPRPPIILGWDGSDFVPRPEFMRTPRPDNESLAEDALGLHLFMLDPPPNWIWARGQPIPQMWGTMLELLYGGHVAEVWEFLEATWPESVPGKEAFVCEFEDSLATSDYWPGIAPAFGADAYGHPCGNGAER